MQEYFGRDLGEVHGMCEGWNEDVCRSVIDLGYYDEQTWKMLVPKLVEMGDRAELHRFNPKGMPENLSPNLAKNDEREKTVEAKWVWVNRGGGQGPARC